VPADASSVNYSLIEVLSKEVDEILRINDIWLLEAMSEANIAKGMKSMILEIHIADNRVLGNAFCNRFFGSIDKLTNREIKFGRIGSTRMACKDIALESDYLKLLENVSKYRIENNKLILFDTLGKEILRYKKVD